MLAKCLNILQKNKDVRATTVCSIKQKGFDWLPSQCRKHWFRNALGVPLVYHCVELPWQPVSWQWCHDIRWLLPPLHLRYHLGKKNHNTRLYTPADSKQGKGNAPQQLKNHNATPTTKMWSWSYSNICECCQGFIKFAPFPQSRKPLKGYLANLL